MKDGLLAEKRIAEERADEEEERVAATGKSCERASVPGLVGKMSCDAAGAGR